MHVTNPIEKECTLVPQALHNKNGVICSDSKVNAFTLTVPREQCGDFLVQFFVETYRITDRATMAALLAKMGAAVCMPTPRIERRAKPRVAGLLLAQEDEK